MGRVEKEIQKNETVSTPVLSDRLKGIIGALLNKDRELDPAAFRAVHSDPECNVKIFLTGKGIKSGWFDAEGFEAAYPEEFLVCETHDKRSKTYINRDRVT